MRRRIGLLVCAGAVACSGSGDDDQVELRDAGFRDVGPREVRVTDLPVDEEIVAGEGTTSLIGDNAVLRQRSDGAYVTAYGVVPAGMTKQEVHYAVRTAPEQWSTELVARPAESVPMASGTLIGLGFDLVNDAPHIAFLGGDDDANVLTPFPTDLAIATKNGGNWATQVVVDTSGEAAGMCMSAQNTCSFGNVVGSHPALRANPAGGYSAVYRDTHGGFADEDLALSDVEIYRSAGGAIMADGERSGGGFADVAHFADGRPIAAYNIYRPQPNDPERTGVWVAYDAGGGTFERRRVSASQTTARVSLAVAMDGTVYLAFYHSDASDLALATSTDGGDTWTVEHLDESGRTGLHPSVALDPQDEPVVAYTYCGATSDRDCPGSLGDDSEVRMVRREAGEWKHYRLHDGQGFGGVGFFNSLVVGADGKVAVVFQDTVNSDLIFVKEQ